MVTTLSTPAGRPASAQHLGQLRASSAASASAGLTTIVQPAATAGPILRVPIASGKFHGVMNRHGPDRLLHRQQPAAAGGGLHPAAVDAHRLLGEPAEELGAVGRPRPSPRRASCPSPGSIRRANSSARSVISSNARRRISPRSRGGVRPSRPAPPPRRRVRRAASPGSASATSVSVEPSAGSITRTASRPRPPARSLPMKSPTGAGEQVKSVMIRSLPRRAIPANQ